VLDSDAFGLNLLLKKNTRTPEAVWFLTTQGQEIIARIRLKVNEILEDQVLDQAKGNSPKSKDIVKTGWMRKQGQGVLGIKLNWNPRWFKLNGNKLTYYEEQPRDGINPKVAAKGNMTLKVGTQAMVGITGGEFYTLEIKQGYASWILRSMAGTREGGKKDLVEWKEAIETAVNAGKTNKANAGTVRAVRELGDKRAKQVSSLFVAWDTKHENFLKLEPVSVAMNLLISNWGFSLSGDVFLGVMKEAGVKKGKIEINHLIHWMALVFGQLSDDDFTKVVSELKSMDLASFT